MKIFICRFEIILLIKNKDLFVKAGYFICSALLVALLSGCASVSSSTATYLPESEQTEGEVFITQSELGEKIQYEKIGDVKANARQGYDNVESLYPMLAEEAKKVGANAVINVYGGRTVSAFSWAAPYTGGTAVKVENPQKLNSDKGNYF